MTSENYQNIDYDDFDDPVCEFHKGRLLTGIYDYGFNKPSPIQSKTIQPIKDGRNLIAQARSGSGKTGAFVIGALTKMIEGEKYPQGVILANTHELAQQIKMVTSAIGKNLNISICLCIGGVVGGGNTEERNLAVARTSQLLVCTPGRLNGLINMCPTLLARLRILVFDEADVLLSSKFIGQIRCIMEHTPRKAQVCLFSATANSENIQRNKDFIVDNPVEIYIKKEQIQVDLIRNYVFNAEMEENKFCILEDLYKTVNVCQSVIFVNSIRSAEELTKQLRKTNHTVGLIHGRLGSFERMRVLQQFRETSIRVLVATDVIARGIDIQKVGLIINYEIPFGTNFEEQYIHRVGRCGRYGKRGVAINLVTNKHDEAHLGAIAAHYSIHFYYLPKLDAINYYLADSKGYSYTEVIKDDK